MATITAGDFRNGKTFEYDGKVMQVVEFQHVKPGKGSPFVRTKMKNVITGAVTETSFNPTAKFEQAFVERRDMQYLYTILSAAAQTDRQLSQLCVVSHPLF